VQKIAFNINNIWFKNSKKINIMKCSKAWWNDNCNRDLNKYQQSKHLEESKIFKGMVRRTKHEFFDNKIDEIVKKNGPWELMYWVKQRKLLAIEAIRYNDQPCIELSNLWRALHSSFNSAQSQQVDVNLLNEIPTKETLTWNKFSKEEILQAIEKCNNSSALGPDKLSWKHIKMIITSALLNCLTLLTLAWI